MRRDLNRRQRRTLAKKLDRMEKGAPSLTEWLSEPGKVVKRGECYNLIHRVWMMRALEQKYNSWYAKLQRAIARAVPWMDDPPPSPFDRMDESLEDAYD